LVLVLQAICFYIPRYFWKIFEGGRVKNLMLNLNQPIVKEGRQAGINLLATYLYENMTLNNTFFFVKYAFTELLNLLNVVFQICLVNLFLGGEFWCYGWNVIYLSGWGTSVEYDPMVRSK